MLDANQKKGAFLTQAVAELGLRNAEVVTQRAQLYRPAGTFDVVISRAFSDLADFARSAGHLCAASGVLIAMKGLHPAAEITGLPTAWQVEKIVPLAVPQLDATRHLVFMRPTRLPD